MSTFFITIFECEKDKKELKNIHLIINYVKAPPIKRRSCRVIYRSDSGGKLYRGMKRRSFEVTK
mgnify:CR=1 FL=1